jgi:hypothetical protein
MAATPEKKVKQACVSIIEKYKAWHFFPAQNGYGVSGTFDICCVLNGYFVGIECKATSKNRPTGLQSHNAAKTLAAGAPVLLIHTDNVALLDALLKEIANAKAAGFDRASVWPFDGVVGGHTDSGGEAS